MVRKLLLENPSHPQLVSSSSTASASAMLLKNGQSGVETFRCCICIHRLLKYWHANCASAFLTFCACVSAGTALIVCFQPVVFTSTVGGAGQNTFYYSCKQLQFAYCNKKEITNKKVIDPEVQVSMPDRLATSRTDCGEPSAGLCYGN